MAIKLVEPNTIVLFAKRKGGKLVEIDIGDELKAVAHARLGYGKEAEEFKEWIDRQPFQVKMFYPEPYPDGIILEGVHIHEIYKDMDGLWGAHITWTDERPYSEEESVDYLDEEE